MRHSLKRAAIPVLATVTACAMCLTAYAAASKDKITKVKLTVDCDGDEPKAGEDVGSVTVKIPEGAKYEISDEPYYYDTKDDVWERGETPVIRLELKVKDPDKDRFSYTSKNYFSISGYHSEFKSAKVLDGGDGLRVEIKLRKVGGELDTVEEMYWDNRTARWDPVEDADKYEVKLYRNSTTVTTITTSNEHYDFYPYMNKAGDYSFKIRSVSNSDGEKSDWSDQSDDYYMNSSDVYTGTPPSSSGGSSGSGSPSVNGGWVQDQNGWMYRQSNGANLINSWVFVDNNWFYLAANGYMMTGWIFVDNNWFYLNPVSDGTRGAMMTGWQAIDGFWYYLNPVSDGTRGARKTSYQFIDGNWYFLDLANGAMWFNRQAPNGKWIDANGVVH